MNEKSFCITLLKQESVTKNCSYFAADCVATSVFPIDKVVRGWGNIQKFIVDKKLELEFCCMILFKISFLTICLHPKFIFIENLRSDILEKNYFFSNIHFNLFFQLIDQFKPDRYFSFKN